MVPGGLVPGGLVPGALPSGKAGSWLGRPPIPGRPAGNVAGRFFCKKSPAAPPPGRVVGRVLGRVNSRKSLIFPCDAPPAGRFPGRTPAPGVIPRLGSKLGLGLVTPPLGSPLPGSRVLGIPPIGSPKFGRPPMPPIEGNRDGNCPIDGRFGEGRVGITEGLPIEGIGRFIEGENPIDGAMLREGIGIDDPPRLMPPPPRIAPPPPRPRWAIAM